MYTIYNFILINFEKSTKYLYFNNKMVSNNNVKDL